VELYFKVGCVPRDNWALMALTFLDNPAFEQVKAHKKAAQMNGTWDSSWETFCSLMQTLFMDTHATYGLRAKLQRLRVIRGDVLGYINIFHNTQIKIMPPLSQEELIMALLNGLDDSTRDQVVIDPSTGDLWTSYYSLFQYIRARFTVKKHHRGLFTKPGDDNREQQGQKERSNRGGQARGSHGDHRRDQYESGQGSRRDRRRDHSDGPGEDRSSKRSRGDPDQGKRHDGRNQRGRGTNKHFNGNQTTLSIKEMTHGQHLSEAQRKMLSEQNRCWHCFEVGHSRQDCPKRTSKNGHKGK
jgi:hypothetical protein